MVKRPAKLAAQMAARGWTELQIAEATALGQPFQTVNRETRRPATRYVHPETGRSVVIEDTTGEVIMSAATASSTDAAQVHVRLLDEAVDTWRPLFARRLSDSVYELSNARPPAHETWAFAPGDAVVVEQRVSDAGEPVLIAVARAMNLDERSAAWLRKAS